jgi:hypothetical protein
MTLVEKGDGGYIVTSNDEELEINFAYDSAELISFQVIDNGPEREFRFFWGKQDNDPKRKLWAYEYKDHHYSVTENLIDESDSYIIERHETYKNIDKIYYIYNDGSIEIFDYDKREPVPVGGGRER